jgi:ADP-ribose pyrophosphatase YjhB (NUDIX family)
MSPPDEPERRLPPTRQDLIRWSETLAAIARTGLGFTESLYERERFEEVLHVAGDIRASVAADAELDVEHYVDEWMRSVGEGVAGYVTPKSAIGAVVHDDQGRILLVQRSDSGVWLYPTGWADVGYSPAEVAVKEVREETGIECVPKGVIAVLDGMRMGMTRIPLYSTVFLCEAIGGELNAHPLETSDVGWFGEDELPPMTVGLPQWGRHAFAAIRGEPLEVLFDPPRAKPFHH